jgi:hypothetical protein
MQTVAFCRIHNSTVVHESTSCGVLSRFVICIPFLDFPLVGAQFYTPAHRDEIASVNSVLTPLVLNMPLWTNEKLNTITPLNPSAQDQWENRVEGLGTNANKLYLYCNRCVGFGGQIVTWLPSRHPMTRDDGRNGPMSGRMDGRMDGRMGGRKLVPRTTASEQQARCGGGLLKYPRRR